MERRSHLEGRKQACNARTLTLKVTSPDFPCQEKFVTNTGRIARLSDSPTYLPANEWGTLLVGDDAIGPEGTYAVAADQPGGLDDPAAASSLAPPRADVEHPIVVRRPVDHLALGLDRISFVHESCFS